MKKVLTIIGLTLLLPSPLFAAKLNGNALAEMFDLVTMDVVPGVSIGDQGTPECDDVKKLCLMDGFSWSDVVGWIAWNGSEIETDVVNNGGVFPEEYYPKMAYNGNLGGYAWSQKVGWVQLSACTGQDNQADCDNKPYCQWTGNDYCEINPNTIVNNMPSQDALDWGVYVDFCELKTTQSECESALSNQYCNWNAGVCEFDVMNNPQGQPLRGYAWSEHLGWIKFAEEAGDPPFGGVFANWALDQTPPIIDGVLGSAWIPNRSAIGTIEWDGFSQDVDSGVDVVKSDVDYTLDANAGYAGCFTQGGNDSAVIIENGNQIDLQFPQIGQISGAVANGHCKYKLSGVIYNKQGVGYFFGSDAKQRATDAGIDPDNPDPHVIDGTDAFLFTLAGDYEPVPSGLFFGADKVADGVSQNESIFLPSDIAGNPIVNIPFTIDGQSTIISNEMVRNVYIGYNFDAGSYFFDSVNPANNILSGDPPPLIIGTDNVTYPESTLISYPKAGPDDNYYELAGGYGLNVKGLAPTGNGNALSMLSVEFETNTKAGLNALPAPSPSMQAYDLVYDEQLDGADGLPLPFNYTFTPALEVISGELSEDQITIEQPMEATYQIRNSSPENSYEMSMFSLDHIFSFEDENEQPIPALEINDLNLDPPVDVGIGRTDRNVGYTRYQLWQEAYDDLTSLSDNAFHSPTNQFHEPLYGFDADNDGVDANGQYETDGLVYLDPEVNPDDIDPIPSILIDRTDHLDEKLASNETKAYQLHFRPSLYLGEAPNGQVSFSIDQYVAYQAYPTNPLFHYLTIYPAPPLISGIKVKSIGLGTDGVVSGGQVYESVTNRDLESITLTSSAALRKEMRRNVATMTRNMNLEGCTTASVSPMPELPTTPSDCVLVDETNQTIVAVYQGGTLILGDGSPIEIPPGYRYTLILDEGANLYLSENMYYSDALSSLGLIVLQDSNGNGGNVYLNPTPTNMVGYLYAEGSLLSSPDDSGNFLYYSIDGPSTTDLDNQLYWQGSIASRNTIGGAPGVIRPEGVTCDLNIWPDAQRCAQAHDLDFIRRFNILYDAQNTLYFSPLGSLFSGGGTCIPGGCTLGPLETTISLINDFIDPDNSKSLDPFYIERDNRPAPPGFTTETGFASTLDIR